MEQEEPAVTPGAGKVSKNQKRRMKRKWAAAKAAAAKAAAEAAAERSGKRSHGRIQRRQAKAAREREDTAQDDTATAAAKWPKQ